MRGRKWTEDEDGLLRQLVNIYGKQWSLIASKMENRTASQVSSRWEKCIDPSLIKGPFSPQEDKQVRDYVREFGPTNWPKLAEILKVRSPKQCRERWYNHLDPNLSKEPWTRDEDLTILKYYTELGPKWSKISEHLTHRSDNAIKNRWNCSISKRVKRNSDGVVSLMEDTQKRTAKNEKSHTKNGLNSLIITNQPNPRLSGIKIISKHGIPVQMEQQTSQLFLMSLYPTVDYPPVQAMGMPQQHLQQMQMQHPLQISSVNQRPQVQAVPQVQQQVPKVQQFPPIQQMQQSTQTQQTE
jgi:hypothetical protein